MASLALSSRWIQMIWVGVVALIVSACGVVSTPQEETLTFEGPPIVMISSPATGNTYQEGVGVNILLRVENAGPDVDRVVIQVDGQIIGEQTLPNQAGDASFVVRSGWPASGAGSHTISAFATRADGTSSTVAEVTINVVGDDTGAADNADAQTDESMSEPTSPPTTESNTTTGSDTSSQGQNTPAPTNPPAPTAVPTNPPPPTAVPTDPPPPTASQPQARVLVGANVRSGPGVVFDPPVGSLAADASVNVLAVNPAGTWYKVQYYNGDAWISGTVVEVSGDIAALPRDAGPPTPIPATNTPVPTPTVSSQIDLIVNGGGSNFGSPACLRPINLQINVVNQGSETSPATALRVTDIQPNGSPGTTNTVNIPSLQPNNNTTVTVPMTISTFVSEQHTFRVTVDPDGGVTESNEGNNTYEHNYTLGQGDC